MTVVVLVPASSGCGSEVLELVVADGDDLFIRQDAFEHFHKVPRADACDNFSFFKSALVVFHKDEKFTQRAEDCAAGDGDGGLGVGQGDTEGATEIRSESVVWVRNRSVNVEAWIVGCVACIETLEDAGKFGVGEDIQKQRGWSADLDLVEFWRLENEALGEKLGVVANFNECGFRSKREAWHGALSDDMARDWRGEGLRGTADGEWCNANDRFACHDLLAKLHEDFDDTTGEWSAD